jgi:2,4-dienoyl-CoA reductase-like NADH-dependent reductase (Old Yellow Enzyme family)
MRFPLEVFEAVRAVWPENKPLGMRVSASDWVPKDRERGGWDIEGTVALAKQLKARGCDFMDVSSGGNAHDQKIDLGPGYQTQFAEAVRRESGLATMAVGMITEPIQAETILKTGQADMIALARALLYDPRWPWHAAAALGDKAFAPPQYYRAHPTLAPQRT